MLTVGNSFPAFTLQGVDKDNNMGPVSPADGWNVIYFYPKDFTFICPTETVSYTHLTLPTILLV